MERDDFIVTENSTETQEIQQEFEEEEKSFEISDEARAQSRKFFKFNDKPKKEKRKFESFEIVKTYTPKEKPKKDNEFDKILETTNESIVSEESLSVKSTNQKAQVKMKLRPQGKLVLIVIAFCVILLSSLIINNAITINKLNESIDNLNNQITVTDFNIDKAVKDLKQQINSISQKQLQAIFQKHFEVYLAAIFGMYKGSSRLNQGRVAEAFEAHLTEHHPNAFQYLNTLNTNSVISKSLLVQFATEAGDSYWAHHEDPNSAWAHIRGAMGTQRGTVAGDVGNRQVKSAKDSGNQVKLSTLTNLKTGIKRYADILNPDISCRDVALKLARYLTEPVKRNEKNLQAYIANKELSTDISKLQSIRLVHI